MCKTVHVAVAVIVNNKGEVCLSLRHKDVHQGGFWEFPGGKIEANETVEQALSREIKEELGLEITKTKALIKVAHEYVDKSVCLHVFRVISFNGEVTGREGQQVKWLALSELKSHAFPEANQAIINALLLPDKYLITGKFNDLDDFNTKLLTALNKGVKLVQLRLKDNAVQNSQQARSIIESAISICEHKNAQLMLNLSKSITDKVTVEMDLKTLPFTGFHLDSQALKNKALIMHNLPASENFVNNKFLLSASCHNKEELAIALQLRADFIVLSPVQPTASHPDIPAMGWHTFGQLIDELSIPAYALGGVSGDDLEIAKQHGAQGVAAISAFWS